MKSVVVQLNGLYVILNFCKTIVVMVLILQKILTILYSLFFEKILTVPVVIWAISFSKNLALLNLSIFATWALKVKNFVVLIFWKFIKSGTMWDVCTIDWPKEDAANFEKEFRKFNFRQSQITDHRIISISARPENLSLNQNSTRNMVI